MPGVMDRPNRPYPFQPTDTPLPSGPPTGWSNPYAGIDRTTASNFYGGYNTSATNDVDVARLQNLYNPQRADESFRNAMRDVGVNPYVSNPYISHLQRIAPAATQAYYLNRAAAADTPGVGGDPNQDFGYYRDYLRNGLANNNLYAGVQTASGNMENYVQMLRDYQARQAGMGQVPVVGGAPQGGGGIGNVGRGGAGNATTVNPWAEALIAQMEGDNYGGASQMMARLNTPFMSAPLASAYQQGLQNATSEGRRRFFDRTAGMTPAQVGQTDIWYDIFGF